MAIHPEFLIPDKFVTRDHDQTKAIDKYEVHVTVTSEPFFWDNELKQRFIDVCKELNIKPLRIENYIINGNKPLTNAVDILTSSEMECLRYPTVYRYMIDIALELELAGFKVIRRKIECSPKNWRVKNMWKQPGTYFESHIKIKDLGTALSSHLPISRNNKAYFAAPNTTSINSEMVTLRCSQVNYEMFQDMLQQRLSYLNYDMGPGGADTEFCVFDDNIKHDAEWLCSYGH